MGLLSRGMSALARVQAENESESVTYYRVDDMRGFAVDAVIGGPGFGQEDNADLPGRIGEWAVDFIIRVSDWEAAGIPFEPRESDVIQRTLTRAGVSRPHNFRVTADNNVPAWDWGEPERVTYVIHTRYES